MEMTHGHDQVP